jgi:hypothetical protein
MANEALVARVVLRDAKTYTIRGRRWIKDVPGVVKGSSVIQSYQENGHFHVTVLKTGTAEPKEEAAHTAAPVAAKPTPGKTVLKKK